MPDEHTWKLLSEEEKANYKIKLPSFVEWELQMFRDKCNFTDDELIYFNLRAKDKSNVQIAMEMNVSEAQVSKLAKRVKSKMKRVL